MFDVFFGLGLVITALLLAVGHWFPWPRRLHRLAAYCYGVGSILAGAGVWLGLHGLATAWQGLLVFAAVGGLVTAGCWLVDWGLNARLVARERGQIRD